MSPFRRAAAAAALVGTTFAGGAIGAALVGSAGAQSNDSSTTTAPSTGSTDSSTSSGGAASSTTPEGMRPPRGPHQANGKTEEALTGDTADKVKAAALEAVPGGTVDRVETDAEGVYEAHMTNADGQRVTVKVDANFKVTGVEEGCGR
jgi:hypothetical protein